MDLWASCECKDFFVCSLVFHFGNSFDQLLLAMHVLVLNIKCKHDVRRLVILLTLSAHALGNVVTHSLVLDISHQIRPKLF